MKKSFIKSSLVASIYVACCSLFLASASAQTDLYVRGAGKLIPVAMPRLCLEAGEGDAAAQKAKQCCDQDGYY